MLQKFTQKYEASQQGSCDTEEDEEWCWKFKYFYQINAALMRKIDIIFKIIIIQNFFGGKKNVWPFVIPIQ